MSPNLEPQRSPGTFARVATAWGEATSLETLVRPLLDTVLELTTLDIAYLTVKHTDEGLEHRFIADPTGLGLAEGLTIPWSDSLCIRCQESGRRWTRDVETDLPGSPISEAFGVRTFLSVPVVAQDGTLMGTLCSASLDAHDLSDTTIAELEVLARLIGDWMMHDRALLAETSRADAAELALDARAMLIARAEHELKTPLTLLSGWAQTLEQQWDELDPAERQAGLAALRRGTDRLHHGVERLLDEAQADVRIRGLELVTVDVGEIASAVVAEVDAVAPAHTVTVAVSPPVTARGDAEAVRQVVAHLVENAIKYSPDPGPVEVLVSTVEGEVVVVVRDEGVGVNEDVDVFEPFVRGVDSGQISGAGLGLHIVKSYVVAMGGTLDARRNPEGGSSFTVRLPAVG